MENKKYKNKLNYILTVVVVIIVYLIIHLYGNVLRDDLYKEKQGYENNVTKPPINNIISKYVDEEIKSISFVRKNVTIRVGGTMKLIVNIQPTSLSSSKLTWSSSDPSIVSVDSNGNIKGLKEGVAIITVTTPNGLAAEVKVTVVKDEIKTKKIIVNPSSLSLDVGAVKQIDATIEPENATNGDLKWSSSNPSIATVDENGVVKGISPGTAIITVKTKDGSVSAQITVIVKEIITVEVDSTKPIDTSKINKPDNVTDNDLVWESSDPSIATVDENGVVTGVTPGKTTVIVKTKDGKIIDQVTIVVEPKETPTDIIFLYDYDPSNYIDLYNQFPIKDEVGKNLQGDKHTQDFKIRFNTGAVGVNYIVTMEKLDGSDLEESWTKAYLVRDGVGVTNCFRTTGRVKTFNEYSSYKGRANEKILYEGVVTSAMAARGYEEYTFRMWVSEDVKVQNENYLSKTFKTRINVYAND